MARLARHECHAPGCHVLVGAGDTYCPAHARPHMRKPDRDRATAHQRGYGSHWQKMREVFLGRPENQLCRRCTAAGRRGVVAEVVHHINGDPRDNRDENLEPLCRLCHERAHGRKRRRWDENLYMD